MTATTTPLPVHVTTRTADDQARAETLARRYRDAYIALMEAPSPARENALTSATIFLAKFAASDILGEEARADMDAAAERWNRRSEAACAARNAALDQIAERIAPPMDGMDVVDGTDADASGASR